MKKLRVPDFIKSLDKFGEALPTFNIDGKSAV